MIEQIEKHLAGEAEATAKEIANALGVRQLDVSKALHQMVNTGTVEREKRVGGGNEYVYWLARGAPAVPHSTGIVGRAACVALADEAHADPGARIVDPPPAANFSCVVRPVVADDEAAPEPTDTDARIAHLAADVARLIVERDEALAVAQRWRANCASLEARIDELTLGPPGAAAPLFVTIGRDAPPKRHSSLEKAQRRGAALIRADKETEVLVLEPVGRIVRGSEWRPR
ncbi:1-pyrroline-5-carboxylate dehydrogenase [Burkholderia gladioli]|uniref:1-pyrroline-5-carboxylate dehydrogenase n=1 Tax=Burkholderia gladioli TaxID=28095 RepID=UPI0023632327|nr:1-pyrroline-5-carboxylate dehydrogenase [Burkholderia gladioli]MDD1789056.1 1-pyrroline-5-carboxylate dehydrogenase [Burkholderia gladioli]